MDDAPKDRRKVGLSSMPAMVRCHVIHQCTENAILKIDITVHRLSPEVIFQSCCIKAAKFLKCMKTSYLHFKKLTKPYPVKSSRSVTQYRDPLSDGIIIRER